MIDPRLNSHAPEAPARQAAKRKPHTLAPVPIKKVAAPRVASRFLNVHTARYVSNLGVFFALTLWWVWVDGPQGYGGIGVWVGAIARYIDSPYQAPFWVQLGLYVILTAIVNSFWFWALARWDWFTEKRWRMALGFVLGTIILLPATAVDVAKGAAGFYGFFAPLDIASPHWWLAGVALVESVGGSVFAQIGVSVMLMRAGGQKG
jgi:hypothetical protein